MKAGRSSKTAEAAAALRANHYLHSQEPVFSDPYALELTSFGWRKLLSIPIFTKVMNSNVMNHTLGLLTGQVVARSRFTEDLLLQAIENNIQQYVLVGAGLDSFVLRLAEKYPQLKIFEVDHPDTQKAKRAKLKKFGTIPANVEFVAIDFEKEHLFDALARSSYQQKQAGFFSWLGTTHYLTPQTTLATLANIASFAAPSSEVVMDYSIDYKELKGFEKFGSFAVSQFTRLLKEPLIGAFGSQGLHLAMAKMGYEIVADLSGHDITERYFKNRQDHIRHTVATHMLHLRIM
ncbi:SAM-dependent methyltransferase [Acinetobacter sp. ANC 4470]|uniref:class I SAM-dependent methyltransferase n=1 Tax=Acinetobacter sp. ANC 4470 TaxID=1977881 RepID=UPI000A331AB3|nr:class I SAM-dependent methyltransferase [Acinetobacter sp. ANC 4470]OTG69242.1 SAM-dependent methyltransferase [Acinetobacter sp. ANC 4470]